MAAGSRGPVVSVLTALLFLNFFFSTNLLPLIAAGSRGPVDSIPPKKSSTLFDFFDFLGFLTFLRIPYAADKISLTASTYSFLAGVSPATTVRPAGDEQCVQLSDGSASSSTAVRPADV